MHPIMTWRFQIWYYLSVAMSELRCIFALGPYSSPCNSFSILFIHLAFLICFLSSHILRHSFVGISSRITPLLAGRIFFRCFEMSFFVCIVWSCFDIILSSFFCQYHLIYFVELCPLFCLLCCFSLFVSTYPSVYPVSYHVLLVIVDF